MNDSFKALHQLFYNKTKISKNELFILFDEVGIPKENCWRTIYRMIFDVRINSNPNLNQRIPRAFLEPVAIRALENIKNKDFSETAIFNLIKDYHSASSATCEDRLKVVVDELYELTNEFKSMTMEKQENIKTLESETVILIESDLNIDDKIKLIKSKFKKTMDLFKTDLIRLGQMSNTDHLTGLYNRRFFDEQLDIEASQSIKEKTCLNLLMIDIDDFKQFNDQYGHPIGDQALRIVSKNIQIICDDELSSNGIFFFPVRYGGEEFAVILPVVDINEAFKIAETIRKKISSYSFVVRDKKGGIKHHNLNLTVSIGLAMLDHRHTQANGIKALIENADAAMYDAKRAGKNCVKIRVE
ncbi:MAG: GGDEF domain-containing protein [Desulfobacteraceae bacterium]|nr:GGDEF domain-containing protein [Desulfobacteraceae bacterium]